MNKTLLLIICDFLLLNLIHFTAWDNVDKDDSVAGAGGAMTLGSGMGDPSQDLDLVKLMLDQSEQEQAATAQQLGKTEEELGKTEEELGKTEEELGKTEEELGNAEKMNLATLSEYEQFKEAAQKEAEENTEENQKLTDKVTKLNGEIGDLTAKVGDLNFNLKTSNQKVTDLTGKVVDLTGDLKAAQAIAAREKQAAVDAKTEAGMARTEATAAKAVAAKANVQIAQANTRAVAAENRAQAQVKQARETADKRAQVAEDRAKEAQGKTDEANEAKAGAEQKLAVAAKENTGLKETVVNERTDKEIAQKAHEEALRQLGDKPINANMMATLYSQNHVDFATRATRTFSKPNLTTKTVLIEVMEYDPNTRKRMPYVHAITHVKETPLRIAANAIGWKEAYGTLSKERGAAQNLHHVRFLESDPRIIIAPVGPPNSAQVKALGVKPYKLAKKPFKFPKAFIMKKDGRKFGEVIFQMDPRNRDYVKLEKGFIRALMGDFQPAQGDLVFSQTGELLGMMANSKYCHIIQEVTPAAAVMFGINDSQKMANTLAKMHRLVALKPYELR
jgi:hypothetical protein